MCQACVGMAKAALDALGPEMRRHVEALVEARTAEIAVENDGLRFQFMQFDRDLTAEKQAIRYLRERVGRAAQQLQRWKRGNTPKSMREALDELDHIARPGDG